MPRYAYKLFNKDLTCRGYQFPIGEWVEEESEGGANTAHNGFHCAHNPLDCLSYYSWDDSRCFIVEIDGDVDEDNFDSKIACTKMKLVKELDLIGFVGHAMKFVISSPSLDSHKLIYDEKYKGTDEDFIIVRGKNPKAMAPKGTVVGLLKESPDSKVIVKADLFVIDGKEHKANRYYEL